MQDENEEKSFEEGFDYGANEDREDGYRNPHLHGTDERRRFRDGFVMGVLYRIQRLIRGNEE